MLRTFPSTLHPPRHILDTTWAELSKWQILLSLNVSRLWELCCRDGVLTLWQWWTDVTALLCLAVTLRHQPCHTQSHGKCHHTSHRVTHRFRSFAESFENKHPRVFCCLCWSLYIHFWWHLQMQAIKRNCPLQDSLPLHKIQQRYCSREIIVVSYNMINDYDVELSNEKYPI